MEILFITMLISSLSILWRNQCVHRYLGDLIVEASRRSKRDIARGQPFTGRWYDALPDYNDMVLHFWRPLSYWQLPPEEE